MVRVHPETGRKKARVLGIEIGAELAATHEVRDAARTSDLPRPFLCANHFREDALPVAAHP